MTQRVQETASKQEAMFSLSPLQSYPRKSDNERRDIPSDSDLLQYLEFRDFLNGTEVWKYAT